MEVFAMSKINYFQDVKTKQEAKTLFRTLAKQYHPDKNKDTDTTAIMADIIDQYESILKSLPSEKTDNNAYSDMSEEEFKAYITQEMKHIIDNIKHLPIEIEIIGSWLWVKSDAKYKAYLTAHNMLWSPNKKMYYWRLERDSMKVWKKKGKPIDEIRETYGSSKVNNSERKAIS
jgi:curved DNA-binding protein CbpA